MSQRASVQRATADRAAAEDRQQFFRRLARRARLRYVTDDEPGISRRVHGRGFSYVHSSGRPVTNPAHRQRIDALVIPPAWKHVWICTHATGHLQVTGRDARGRKQYIYHERWRAISDRVKFDHLLEVGELLPKIRRRVARDLRGEHLTRDLVCALVVRLLDLTAARVGNVEYARDNDSYGLTTLQNRHVTVRGSTVRLAFKGKSGKRHDLEVTHTRVARLIARCRELPGTHLIQYDTDEGCRPLTSEDVNEYLARITDGAVTAKDFRTWHASAFVATRLAADCAAESGLSPSKRTCTLAIRQAAELLGNTATVCGKYYVHADLVSTYMAGRYSRLARRFQPRRTRWYGMPDQLLLHVLRNIA
jgi:DNA topoisomerase-1